MLTICLATAELRVVLHATVVLDDAEPVVNPFDDLTPQGLQLSDHRCHQRCQDTPTVTGSEARRGVPIELVPPADAE
eukprot:1475491-Rhodomonas_salina.1